jgi:hypothetical protein
MKQLIVNIPETKFQFFVELTKQLGFEIEKELIPQLVIPQWQLDELDKRVDDYQNNKGLATDFDKAMDDIEKGL